MPLDDVMNALGGAGQVLVASIVAVILLVVVLWILVPLTVIGLRSRLSEVRDDQRRVLGSLRDQQHLLNEMLGALLEEQQLTNDMLARLTEVGEAEGERERTSAPRAPAAQASAAPESAPVEGRATDRGPRRSRPLIAHR